MRSAVNAFVLWCAPAALQAALVLGAAAADDGAVSFGTRQPGAGRWVPSFAATAGITIQEWNGAVSSQICQGCSIPDPLMREVPLRRATSSNDFDVTPFVGGDFELMTPTLPLPSAPRLFIGASVLASLGFERSLAKEGDPGTLASPLPQGNESTIPYSEDAVLGQGSETTAQLDTLVYGARAGIAFPLELFGRALRLKPSIGWIRYDVDAKGAVSDAECQTAPPPPAGNTNCNSLVQPPGSLRAIQLSASDSSSFDGIGGGLDIEMDTLGFGPLGCSLFIGAHAFKILGNREIEFGDSESFPDAGLPGLGAAATAAQFGVEVDPVMFRVGVGLRLHWLGDSDAP